MAQSFTSILTMAEKRKGGSDILHSILSNPLSNTQLSQLPDDRFLAMMTKAINQAGFNWTVIANKWPQFEEAFHDFNVNKLTHLPPEAWDAYIHDKRVVRHGQKIKTVRDNAFFISQVAKEHGSFAAFIANWPESDYVGLLAFLKKHGSRLGGNTGQWFLRYIRKDGFILTKDVTLALQHAQVDVNSPITSKRDFTKAQDAFNQWHQETGLCYTHLSNIAAYSIGTNYEIPFIEQEMAKFSN